MCDRVDERSGIRDRALTDEIRPELPRQVELVVDLEGPRNVDGAVAFLVRIVQFAQGSVPGARIVPRVGTLFGRSVERLEDRDAQIRVELLEQGGEGRAHDARADEGNI